MTNQLYTETISSYGINNDNQCIICFNDDISMNLMYTCINCKECLICRQCVIKIIFKKIMDALFVEQKIDVKIAMVKSLFLNINQRNEMKIDQLQMKFIIMLSV